MSSCLARAIFCALSRSTPASSTRLGHIRVFGRNNPCLEHPRQMVVSSHTRSSMGCITIIEGRREALFSADAESSQHGSRESLDSRNSRDSHAHRPRPYSSFGGFRPLRVAHSLLPALAADLPNLPMTCRVDRIVSGDHLVVLCISGRITGQDLDMLRDLLGLENGAVAIDFKGVLLVDREVAKFLAVSEANGIELRNCPAYIREWVARERAQTHEEQSNQGTGAREDIEDV